MPVDYIVALLPLLFVVGCLGAFWKTKFRVVFLALIALSATAFVGIYLAPEWVWLRAAKQGDVKAQVHLGYYYWTRFGNLGSDFKKKDFWFLKAAENGDVPSMEEVGNSYMFGDVDYGGMIPKDYKQARYWLQKAESGGDIDAKQDLVDLSKEELVANH